MMRRTLPIALVLLCTAAAVAQTVFPKPTGRITDLAKVIDDATEADLTTRLEQLEARTSHEVAVVTVNGLDGLTMDDYKVRLFKEWGVGQAKADNGVLVVVAFNERAIGIEVGYGLEGVLPDGLAGQIIDRDFIPRFRKDDYDGGIRDGVTRVIEVIEKEQVLSAEEIARLNAEGASPTWAMVPFMGIFVGIGFTMLGIGLRAKTVIPLLFGALFGGMALAASYGFMGRVALWTLAPFALLVLACGFRLGARQRVRDAFRNTAGKGGSSSDGWAMGGSIRSSSRSSSSSSGGGASSSFGGGSSGGGGASRRW